MSNQIKGRDVLIALSMKYNGDWELIYDAVKRHEVMPLEEIESLIKQIKSKYITLIDDEYPSVLKNVINPPFVLYYYGDITLISSYQKNLSVVGSRHPSDYGIRITKKIVKDLNNELTIVSGLAMGIDAVAHKTALDNGGKTVAILCSGIDTYYPNENYALNNEIREKGLVISEYPGTVFPDKTHIPFRNRLIAGLSHATLVTDAYDRSGTSITVNYALCLSRDIFAIPHDITDKPNFCNYLIKQGAKAITSADDILEEYKN